MDNYTQLKVWKKSKNLAVGIYKLTDLLPFSKDFRLRDQMRSASVSIPSNIAEGDELGRNKQSIPKAFWFVLLSYVEKFSKIMAKNVGIALATARLFNADIRKFFNKLTDKLNRLWYIRHFYIAKGSTAELITQLVIAFEIGYLEESDYQELKAECEHISHMLAKLISAKTKTINP